MSDGNEMLPFHITTAVSTSHVMACNFLALCTHRHNRTYCMLDCGLKASCVDTDGALKVQLLLTCCFHYVGFCNHRTPPSHWSTMWSPISLRDRPQTNSSLLSELMSHKPLRLNTLLVVGLEGAPFIFVKIFLQRLYFRQEYLLNNLTVTRLYITSFHFEERAYWSRGIISPFSSTIKVPRVPPRKRLTRTRTRKEVTGWCSVLSLWNRIAQRQKKKKTWSNFIPNLHENYC